MLFSVKFFNFVLLMLVKLLRYWDIFGFVLNFRFVRCVKLENLILNNILLNDENLKVIYIIFLFIFKYLMLWLNYIIIFLLKWI